MIFRFLILIILAILSISAADPLFEFRGDSLETGFVLESDPPETTFVKTPIFNNSKAMVLDLGRITGKYSLKKFFPVHKKGCVRFQFAYDSINILSVMKWAARRKNQGFDLFALYGNETGDFSPETTLFAVRLVPAGMEWRLQFLNTENLIKPGTPYNIEIRYCLNGNFNALDSVEFRLNGETLFSGPGGGFNFRISTLVLGAGCLLQAYLCTGRFYYDNIAFSDTWMGSPAAIPVLHNGKSAVYPLVVRLFSPDYRPFIQSSDHSATRYQIHFLDSLWELPLYDSGMDSLCRDSLVSRMVLDGSMKYFWRVRQQSREGSETDWSAPAELPYRTDATAPELILHPRVLWAHFTPPGRNSPLNRIGRGEWADLCMAVWDTSGFKDIAYAVFFATRRDCPEGGVQERGGRFFSAANYVYNFQADPPRIFAKEYEGKAISTPITGKLGRYIDAREGACSVDSAKGILRLRVRFPEEAQPGEWRLRGFVRNESDLVSPLFYSRFTLTDETGRPGGARLWFLLLVPLLAVAAWAFHRRKKAVIPGKPSREEETYGQFILFVHDNISRELNQEELEKRFCMSYSNLFRIIKKVSGKNIKKAVLEIKMEKAQELLRTTTKNVNEVMVEVGFLDPSHFSQVFRKFTGKTPSEFSRQYLQK